MYHYILYYLPWFIYNKGCWVLYHYPDLLINQSRPIELLKCYIIQKEIMSTKHESPGSLTWKKKILFEILHYSKNWVLTILYKVFF